MGDTGGKTGSAGARMTRDAWWALALVAVLAAGVLIGVALSRRGDADTPREDTAAETTATAPAEGVTGERPTIPAPEGSALPTITTPPADTLAMIDPTKLSADARYSVTFRPYGYGPPQGGVSMVVWIERAEPDNDAAAAFDPAERNVVAVLEDPSAVALGGTYTGSLGFRTQGGLLVPVLTDVAAQ